jgi:hypothetical protein
MERFAHATRFVEYQLPADDGRCLLRCRVHACQHVGHRPDDRQIGQRPSAAPPVSSVTNTAWVRERS